jgi:hypothetical protein
MAEVRKGWHEDPFGIHELRYFSIDGIPSRLVRDGGVQSSDPPPEHMPIPAPDDRRGPPRPSPNGRPCPVPASPVADPARPPDRSSRTPLVTDEETIAGDGSHPTKQESMVPPPSRSLGHWRKVLLVVVIAVGLVAGVVALVVGATSSTAQPPDACSLLTSAQVQGLIGGSGRTTEQALHPHANGCDYVNSHSGTSILIVLQQAPNGFPNPDVLRGQVVKIDDQTTYFVPGPQTPPGQSPTLVGRYLLLAVKDGHEASIQVGTRMPQQEVIARRAMSLILPKL